MKQLFLSMLLLCTCLTSTQAEVITQVTNITARKTTSLNGQWNYIVDVQEEGYYDYRMNPTPWGFFQNAKPQRPEDLIEYDFDKAPTMQIPGDWNTQDKPVIISEFGGGARYGLHGTKNQRWTEEFQENLYRENIAMINKIDGLAGTTPWVLKDFRSPRRVLNGIQDYYNRKGVYSDEGQKKKAFYILQEWYKGK